MEIAEKDHRLNTLRPGTGTALTRPIEDPLRLLVPPKTLVATSVLAHPGAVITRPIENLLCVGRSLSRLDRGAIEADRRAHGKPVDCGASQRNQSARFDINVLLNN